MNKNILKLISETIGICQRLKSCVEHADFELYPDDEKLMCVEDNIKNHQYVIEQLSNRVAYKIRMYKTKGFYK